MTRPKQASRHPGFADAAIQHRLEERRLKLDPDQNRAVFVVWSSGCREPFAAVADEAVARKLAHAAAKPGRTICLFRGELIARFATAAPEVIVTEESRTDPQGKARP
jgi:molybdopterin-guanine dinucleotide biosynthesis protein A